MTFTIQPATRVGINPLIVPYSESGCGKTYSSLLLARGLAGPTGKIVVADSESRRASLYADVLPGGFETFDLCEPFSAARYVEAIDTIEASGAAVGIIDSGSHEWEGPGGILDAAGEAEHRSGKPGLHNWRLPKLEHAKFVQRLLRTKIPFIICLRAKYKSRQIKGTKEMADDDQIRRDQIGKTIILKDDYPSPIQAEDFIFEATAHFEILQDHSIRITKCSHPSLRDCFPKSGPITIAHGQALAQWCAAPGKAPSPKPTPQPEGILTAKALKSKLWKMTAEKHNQDPKALEQFLWDEGLMSDTESLSELTPERLIQVVDATEKKLQEIGVMP